MIVAKVITGEYCEGRRHMKCAPYKPRAPLEQYDSVVDNVDSPTMYAVFHDAAAYADYVIKFTSDSDSSPAASQSGCSVM